MLPLTIQGGGSLIEDDQEGGGRGSLIEGEQGRGGEGVT